jgi:hypothetical protein
MLIYCICRRDPKKERNSTNQGILGYDHMLCIDGAVWLVHEVKPLKSIIDEMVSEAESEFQRLKKLFEN